MAPASKPVHLSCDINLLRVLSKGKKRQGQLRRGTPSAARLSAFFITKHGRIRKRAGQIWYKLGQFSPAISGIFLISKDGRPSMMMNRREFMGTAAASAAMLSGATKAFGAAAARYDLIIKGGRVIDTSTRLNGVRDVAISQGKIVAVEANIAGGAADMLDARGKVVMAGLIDVHTHCGRSKEGPALCLKDGVTGWVDAGSQGADHIGDTIAVAKSSPQQGRVLINIGRAGILPEGDTMDINRADVNALRAAIMANRDYVVGIKARLSRDVAGNNDLEVLTRAQRVATELNLPVMIHMGQTMTPIGRLMNLMKKGDIVTHMFRSEEHT